MGTIESTCVYREPNVFEKSINWIRRALRKKQPSNTRLHALREFKATGYLPISECEDGPNKWIQENILELLDVFSNQGHSGFSAPYCINMFAKLAKFEPLCPLTGADDEWNDVSDHGGRDGGALFQNNRCSHVFKDDGRAYDINAVVYEEPSGRWFTRGGARHYIEFPYTPTRKIVQVDFDGNEVSEGLFATLKEKYEKENQ